MLCGVRKKSLISEVDSNYLQWSQWEKKQTTRAFQTAGILKYTFCVLQTFKQTFLVRTNNFFTSKGVKSSNLLWDIFCFLSAFANSKIQTNRFLIGPQRKLVHIKLQKMTQSWFVSVDERVQYTNYTNLKQAVEGNTEIKKVCAEFQGVFSLSFFFLSLKKSGDRQLEGEIIIPRWWWSCSHLLQGDRGNSSIWESALLDLVKQPEIKLCKVSFSHVVSLK